MDTDAWQRLARKTRRAPFFYIGAPVVRSSPRGVEIVEGPSRYVSIVADMVIGPLFLIVPFHVPGVFGYIFGGLGGLAVVGTIAGIFQIRRISTNPFRASFRIVMGYFPFAETYEFDSGMITVELTGSEDDRLGGKVYPGKSALILSNSAKPQSVIKLAVTESKSKLEKAYHGLSEWLGGKASDKTLETALLEDGSEIQFARTSLGSGGANFQDRKLVFDSPDTIALRNTFTTRWFYPAFIVAGALLLLYLPSALRGNEFLGDLFGGVILSTGFGFLFIYAGIAGIFGVFQTGFSVDRRNRVVKIEECDWRFRRTEHSIPLGEILGIQVLLDYVEGTSDSAPYLACEMNLLLKNPNGQRITLMKHAKEQKVLATARQLSEFLGCRLFDHREKAGLS